MTFVTVTHVSVGWDGAMYATGGVGSGKRSVSSLVHSPSVVYSWGRYTDVVHRGQGTSDCTDSVREIIVCVDDRLFCVAEYRERADRFGSDLRLGAGV